MTNGNKIRSMSDYELAKDFMFGTCPYRISPTKCQKFISKIWCSDCRLEWLKQEAPDDESRLP